MKDILSRHCSLFFRQYILMVFLIALIIDGKSCCRLLLCIRINITNIIDKKVLQEIL